MASDLQTKALDTLVEMGRTKKRILKGQVLKKAGYSKAVQEHPQKVFESKGFLELCDSLGLTDDFLTRALVNDIKKKPGKRTRELELGFKVRGKLKDNDKGAGDTTNNFLIIGGDQLKRIASRVLDGNTEEPAASSGLPDSDQP